MRVGSLHSPWEYDGRPPPDAGYYLDLVLPRFEEPRKKIGSQVRLLHGRILQIKWSTYMQSNPRIVVNVLILAETLVNLLVKTLANLLVRLAESRVRGAIGAPGPGNTLGRGSYDLQLVRTRPVRLWFHHLEGDYGTMMRLWWDYLLGILLELLGILGILPDVLGFTWNMSNIGKTIGNIS